MPLKLKVTSPAVAGVPATDTRAVAVNDWPAAGRLGLTDSAVLLVAGFA